MDKEGTTDRQLSLKAEITSEVNHHSQIIKL